MSNLSIIISYHLILLIAIMYFAVYDLKYKRVPNVALAYFLPWVLLSIPVNILAQEQLLYGMDFWFFQMIAAILGSALGGGVLLLAAMITNGGIGGGDIKLAAMLGFVYGPYGMILILLIATPLATVFGILQRKHIRIPTINLAFVPFMAVGCYVVTALTLF